MAKHWIKKATANSHGQFRAKAEKAGESTAEFASEHAGDSDKLGKQARLAKALMGAHHNEGGPVTKSAKLYGKKKVARRG